MPSAGGITTACSGLAPQRCLHAQFCGRSPLMPGVRHLPLREGEKMKLQNLAAFFLVSAILILPLPAHNLAAAASLTQRKKLHLVKSIYVSEEKEYELSEVGAVKQSRLISNLRDELVRVGFVIVNDAAGADATLKGEFGWNAVLDGPQPDPPEYYYEYQLVDAGNERLWQSKFTLKSKLDEWQVDRDAAAKIAGKLLSEWLKSAKRAGLNVSGRVQ